MQSLPVASEKARRVLYNTHNLWESLLWGHLGAFP